MATLQVKNVPDELHRALRDRAASEGSTVSDFVLRTLREELSLPSVADWVAMMRALPERDAGIEGAQLLDEVRDEYDPRS